MAAKARVAAKDDHGGVHHAQPTARPKAAAKTDDASPSPALMLQQALEADLNESTPGKWSPAKTTAFVVGTCGTFWGLVALGLYAVLK